MRVKKVKIAFEVRRKTERGLALKGLTYGILLNSKHFVCIYIKNTFFRYDEESLKILFTCFYN